MAFKLSYFHNIGKYPLMAITVGNLLDAAATKFAEREAVVSREQQQRLTYQELLQKADAFAAGLRILGLKKGDRVGIWATNITEWYILNMAIARGGFYMVALNPQYQAAEMEYSINKVGMKLIVCLHKSKYQNFYDVLTEIAPELKTMQLRRLNNEKIPSLKSVIIIGDENLNGTYNYNEVMELADNETIKKIKADQNLIQPDDPCCIIYSSGTTGQPKAAVLSHFQIVNNGFCISKRNELDQKHHRISLQVPFFHVFGTTIAIAAALHFGTTIVLPWSTYNPIENLKCLKEESCSIIYGTPTMYIDLINIQKKSNEDICPEIVVTGGASCPPELFNQIKNVLKAKRVKTVFGMTESSPITFQSLPIEENEFQVTSTIGYVGDHLEVKIVDENNMMVPMGTPGELCVRGYCTMLGYWGDEEKTKEILGPDNWLHTGDQLVLQEDGYGKIVGRLKDLIIRGGENIFPKEIEDILSTHPDILEVQVIGLPHERLGEEVCACARIKEGSELTQKTLSEYFKEKIAFAKIPTKLKIMEEFPKTLSGKIQKYKLRDNFLDNENEA